MEEKFFPLDLLDTTNFVFIQSIGTVQQHWDKRCCGCFGAYIAMKKCPGELHIFDKGRNWFYDRCLEFGIDIEAGQVVLDHLAFHCATPLDSGIHHLAISNPFDYVAWKNEPADVMSWFNDYADHIRSRSN